MTTDDSEDAVDSRKQGAVQQYGMSDDQVNRYLLAFPNDERLAHRKMAATFVSLSTLISYKSHNGRHQIMLMKEALIIKE